MPSNCPLAPHGNEEAMFGPVSSTPFNKKKFSDGRRPDTENQFPPPPPGLPVVRYAEKLIVPGLSVIRRSKLRPLSGKSFTCCSPTSPEIEAVVVFTSGISP